MPKAADLAVERKPPVLTLSARGHKLTTAWGFGDGNVEWSALRTRLAFNAIQQHLVFSIRQFLGPRGLRRFQCQYDE